MVSIEKKPVLLAVSPDGASASRVLEWFNCFADVIAATAYDNAKRILSSMGINLIVVDGYGDEMATAFKVKYPQITVCVLTNDLNQRRWNSEIHYIEKTGDRNLMLACILGVWLADQKELIGHLQPLREFKYLLCVTRRESINGMEALSMALRHDPDVQFLSSACRNPDHLEKPTMYLAPMAGCYAGCRMCFVCKIRPTLNFTPQMMLAQIAHLRASYIFHGISMDEELSFKFFDGGDPLYCWREICGTIKMYDYSNTRARYTVCTVGDHSIFTNMEKEVGKHKVELELSVHSPNERVRNWLIPASTGSNLKFMIDSLINYNVRTGNKTALRYMLVNGLNDSEREVAALAHLLSGSTMEVKVMSLVDGTLPEYPSVVTKANCERFIALLRNYGVNASYKKNMGSRHGQKMGTQVPACQREELFSGLL